MKFAPDLTEKRAEAAGGGQLLQRQDESSLAGADLRQNHASRAVSIPVSQQRRYYRWTRSAAQMFAKRDVRLSLSEGEAGEPLDFPRRPGGIPDTGMLPPPSPAQLIPADDDLAECRALPIPQILRVKGITSREMRSHAAWYTAPTQVGCQRPNRREND